MNNTIPCLSLWQPWASAIFVPTLKPIETRHWRTSRRGRLAIHAAKASSRDLRELFAEKVADGEDAGLFAKHGITKWSDLPMGAILGTVEIVDCAETATHNPLGQGEELRQEQNRLRFEKYCASGMWPIVELWGDFSPGRFGHCYTNIVKFAEPIPWRGAQGFFNVEVPA